MNKTLQKIRKPTKEKVALNNDRFIKYYLNNPDKIIFRIIMSERLFQDNPKYITDEGKILSVAWKRRKEIDKYFDNLLEESEVFRDVKSAILRNDKEYKRIKNESELHSDDRLNFYRKILKTINPVYKSIKKLIAERQEVEEINNGILLTKNKYGKWNFVIKEIKQRHQEGRQDRLQIIMDIITNKNGLSDNYKRIIELEIKYRMEKGKTRTESIENIKECMRSAWKNRDK